MNEVLRPTAFLDRDGVINVDHGYVYRWEDFEFVPGAVEGMRRLSQAGFALVVVTNQSGIARGMYTEDDFGRLTHRMCQVLGAAGAPITAVHHCPHHPRGSVPGLNIDCDCRKPKPGLISRALSELGLQASSSFLIGDKMSDIEAARAAGIARAYLVASDKNEEGARPGVAPDGVFADLKTCVDSLLRSAQSVS